MLLSENLHDVVGRPALCFAILFRNANAAMHLSMLHAVEYS